MSKDANGKNKTRAKMVKGGKCATEKQDVNEYKDSLRNILILKLRAPRIFERSGSSAGAEIVGGASPNQERAFFRTLTKWSYRISFSFSLPKDFLLLLIFL